MPFAGDFCTIMREPNPKAVYPCFIVPYFSSPNLKYNGEALGVQLVFHTAYFYDTSGGLIVNKQLDLGI